MTVSRIFNICDFYNIRHIAFHLILSGHIWSSWVYGNKVCRPFSQVHVHKILIITEGVDGGLHSYFPH